MSQNVLSFKTGVSQFWDHDNSVVIFQDGTPTYGIETERVLRSKHGNGEFPTATLELALKETGLTLSDIDTLALPYDTQLEDRRLQNHVEALTESDMDVDQRSFLLKRNVDHYESFKSGLRPELKANLDAFDGEVGSIETYPHHQCHAASAFYPADFEDGLVLTIDGTGEYDSTVVWHVNGDSFERIRTYEFPNSLGMFYGLVTAYLGYRRLNGEGKIMGLAPYGESNSDIEETLRSAIRAGVEYDVRELTRGCTEEFGVEALEELFGREAKTKDESFSQWDKDLAYATQRFTEETVTDIVEHYCRELGVENVALAGGVALNCKLNKAILELPTVEQLFVQPVANDAGLSLGAAMLASDTDPEMESAFLGPQYDSQSVRNYLDVTKIEYSRPDDLERTVAEELADGALVGWFQGRMEMGPRALGHRSILADPRTADSRDRVNKFVKNREQWRPFAPSMLEEAADDYLLDASPAPFMIKTFDVAPGKRSEMSAVVHPADDTTRPQLVSSERNPRYHRLISEFRDVTGTPVLLNTSFNDSGEPIVNSPKNAIDDFFSMGLDLLVIEDTVIRK